MVYLLVSGRVPGVCLPPCPTSPKDFGLDAMPKVITLSNFFSFLEVTTPRFCWGSWRPNVWMGFGETKWRWKGPRPKISRSFFRNFWEVWWNTVVYSSCWLELDIDRIGHPRSLHNEELRSYCKSVFKYITESQSRDGMVSKMIDIVCISIACSKTPWVETSNGQVWFHHAGVVECFEVSL